MIYKNIKERQDHKFEILSNKIDELETQLESYSKLHSEVHKGIERVWSIDNTLSPSPEDYDLYLNHLKRNPFSDDEQNKVSQLNKERSEIIEEMKDQTSNVHWKLKSSELKKYIYNQDKFGGKK